ncbi:MAG: hypothetical protein GY707_03370 [Desulfobacteraceae bacterium]|nr:hypothetical protein [Desulfobacteraceae bacterium]
MAFLRIVFTLIIGFSYLVGFALCATASPYDSNSSFNKLVGGSEWKITLKNFTLSQKKDGNTFELRMGDEKYFGFSAFSGQDTLENRFGPFSIEYKDSLAELLAQGMTFSGQEKSGQFAMGISWRMYPESIKKWARTWQNSSLRKEWDKTEQHSRYKSLTTMISEFLKEDMQAVANAIGFESTGASMEKMAYFSAGKLKLHNKVIKIEGVAEDLEIPIPLMLWLTLKPVPGQETTLDNKTDLLGKTQVDSLFVTAELNSTNVYCTFQRVFDEYKITGDTIEQNGTYTRILPVSNPEYQAIAGKMFQACLKATNADKQETVFLRINLKQYPKVYRQVIEHFNFSFEPAGIIKRPGLSNKKFYEYMPETDLGFQAQVNPFLEQNGYVFNSFEINLESRRKAKKYSDFEKTFKPLGIKSDDKPFVPSIVYMKIVRKKI